MKIVNCNRATARECIGFYVRMRRSKKGSSSETPTRMLSNSGVECTHGRTDVLRYTLSTTKFIRQRGLQGDRKLVFIWEEGPEFILINKDNKKINR